MRDTGYHIEEGTLRGTAVTVTMAEVYIEMRWTCPNVACGTRWRKAVPRFSTHQRTCPRCGIAYWLRPPA